MQKLKGRPIKVQLDNAKRRGTSYDATRAPRLQLAALQKELEHLIAEREALETRHAILLDVCESLRLVGDCCHVNSMEEINRSVQGAAWQALEAEIRNLCKPAASSLEVKQGRAALLCDCLEIIATSMKPEFDLLAPAHTSLLRGQPLSLLLTVLLCYSCDAQLRAGRRADFALGPEARAPILKHGAGVLHSCCLAVVESAEASEDGQPSAEFVKALATVYIIGQACTICFMLQEPKYALYQGILVQDEADKLKEQMASEAQLDCAIEAIGLTDCQVKVLINGLQLLSDLQAPLDREQAAIMARIRKLLKARGPVFPEVAKGGPSPGDPGAGAAATTGLLHCAPSGGDAAVGAGQVAAASLQYPASAAAPRGTTSGNSNTSSSSTNTSSSSSQHEELLSLGRRLDALQCKLKWLDLCASCFVDGQISWLQFAKYSKAMAPHIPSTLPMGRRLMTRTSLQWLVALRGGEH